MNRSVTNNRGGSERVLLAWFLLMTLAGCDVFSAREPEFPVGDGGSYVQPDTPDQVVENTEAAVSTLSTSNYRRLFAPSFTFRPTPTALAREQIWSGWGRTDEDRYFTSLASALLPGGSHDLELEDATLSIASESRYIYEASYVLMVQHSRQDVPRAVSGRLVWVLTQETDGLWYISEWTDQEVENSFSWSDLKAAFYK